MVQSVSSVQLTNDTTQPTEELQEDKWQRSSGVQVTG